MLPLWILRIRHELHIALPIETRNRINPGADGAPAFAHNGGKFISACQLLNLERSVSRERRGAYADEIVS